MEQLTVSIFSISFWFSLNIISRYVMCWTIICFLKNYTMNDLTEISLKC